MLEEQAFVLPLLYHAKHLLVPVQLADWRVEHLNRVAIAHIRFVLALGPVVVLIQLVIRAIQDVRLVLRIRLEQLPALVHSVDGNVGEGLVIILAEGLVQGRRALLLALRGQLDD